jgi:hypothetical protein
MRDENSLESKIVQAYVLLSLTRVDSKGQQTVSVENHGTYDVRLVEHPGKSCANIMFWVELFDHQTATTLDSYAVDQIEEAVATASGFISVAEALNRTVSRTKH